MKNRWNAREARLFQSRYKQYGDDLALRTYSARLIGQESRLVLHGGGNTSVKTVYRSFSGSSLPVICIKGSGWDLHTIEPQGHPAVRMDALTPLQSLPSLSDEAMVNILRTNMMDSLGPTPSVETLLHAFLPQRFIDHSHADAILSITNQPDGEKRVRSWAGSRMGIVPYVMPGFALAKKAAEIYEARPEIEGLILLKHGIFTWGASAKESYDRMVYWVNSAERLIARSKLFNGSSPSQLTIGLSVASAANMLRGASSLSPSVETPEDPPMKWIVRHRTNRTILSFAASRHVARHSQQGPATPDHIIRTKALPLLMTGSSLKNEQAFRTAFESRLAAYSRQYRAYFERQSRLKKVVRTCLDPLPRLILVPGLGLFSMAANAHAADIALDIYEHTMEVIMNAERIGHYEALSESHLFDMEYWSLEQAKLGKTVEKPFSGQIVWISGAASGIGLATAKVFGGFGAHVFLTDRDTLALEKALKTLGLNKQAACMGCDVTRAAQVEAAFDRCSQIFGGIDIVISNAGVAPMHEMATCTEAMLRQSFEVNFFAHQSVAQSAARVFKRQGTGGALLFNASKSAFNPGPGFGPYTLPKAGVIALMRQYAIELGAQGVRVNAVNADRVHTALFANGLLKKRARARGLSVMQYLKGNLLGKEVLAEDVALGFAALAGARKTTGAVLPIDGGNAAAFPR